MDSALQALVDKRRITPLAAYEKAINKELFKKAVVQSGATVPPE